MQEYYIRSPFPPLSSASSQSWRSQITDSYLSRACSICGYMTETHICLVYYDLFYSVRCSVVVCRRFMNSFWLGVRSWRQLLGVYVLKLFQKTA